jgi:phosphoribosylformylglycinamidine (FGAM) synthase PurS component
MKSKIYTELFALTFKDSGAILTPDSYKEYWKGYGQNDLSGWKPPKKIYYTLGTAKAGFGHIPEQIKPLVEISKFVRSECVIDGAGLQTEQKVKRDKKEELRKTRQAKYALELAERNLAEAKSKLEKLKNKTL